MLSKTSLDTMRDAKTNAWFQKGSWNYKQFRNDVRTCKGSILHLFLQCAFRLRKGGEPYSNRGLYVIRFERQMYRVVNYG